MFNNTAEESLGYRSLTECVMDYLKRQLNNRELKPGDEINLKVISKSLGISRTPIREALIQLLKDGFVEIISRRKFIIKRVTIEDIKYIYHVVGLLEAEAAKDACNKIADAEIGELERLYQEMEKALNKDDSQTYLDLNIKSHTLISKYCDNPILLNIMNNLKERLYVFPRLIMMMPEWEKKLMGDHQKIIQFLRKKNQSALEDLIKNEHWNFSKNYPFIIKYYEIFDKKTP